MSHAFSGCSGLGLILKQLEGKADTAPSVKPMAKKPTQLHKNKKKAEAAKAAKAEAAKAKAALAKAPAAKAPAAKAKATAGGAKAKAAAGGAPAKAPPAKAAGMDMSRKCVHSRAYHAAARVAKAAGLSKPEISETARAAGKVANEKWDLENP